jgi:hypothetical protein
LGYFLKVWANICGGLKSVDVDVLTSKLNFNEDILAFFVLATVWASFFRNLGNFFLNFLVTLQATSVVTEKKFYNILT